jgi:hypothetical protein
MSSPSSRQNLIDYCLRKLGHPVLEINIDDDQLEDRIDEALEYWRQYHHEGIEKVYLKQIINASTLTLTSNNAEDFKTGSVVTGQTSGAKAVVCSQFNKPSEGNTLVVRYTDGTFVSEEDIESSDTVPVTGTLAATDFYTEGETEKRYFEVPDAVYGVTRIIPFTAINYSSKSIFDIQYQLRLNDLYDLTSTSIIYYKSVMSHLALLDIELNGKPMCRFNRLQNRVYPDINWADNIYPGQYMVIEAYRALDPTQFTRVWNEAWLKHYTTALVKRQWAINLKKFSGIQLPGGVTLDGQTMYVEAMQEIKDLEDELQNKAAPLEFFLG